MQAVEKQTRDFGCLLFSSSFTPTPHNAAESFQSLRLRHTVCKIPPHPTTPVPPHALRPLYSPHRAAARRRAQRRGVPAQDLAERRRHLLGQRPGPRRPARRRVDVLQVPPPPPPPPPTGRVGMGREAGTGRGARCRTDAGPDPAQRGGAFTPWARSRRPPGPSLTAALPPRVPRSLRRAGRDAAAAAAAACEEDPSAAGGFRRGPARLGRGGTPPPRPCEGGDGEARAGSRGPREQPPGHPRPHRNPGPGSAPPPEDTPS